jgi:regulatory protein
MSRPNPSPVDGRSTDRRQPRPYDEQSLAQAALDYAARYATTRAKLASYLRRKLREKGWAGEESPPVDHLVERFADRGFVNDELFARARADSLTRRGYGVRRIETVLRSAGIEGDLIDACRDQVEPSAEDAALAFARRRRLGPFSQYPQDVVQNRKALAAMLRAGHDFDIARKILAATLCDDDDT